MSKPMIYKTVICKVNGITLLDLNNDNNTNYNNTSNDNNLDQKKVKVNQQTAEEDNEDDIEVFDDYDNNEDNEEEEMQRIDSSSDNSSVESGVKGTVKIVARKGVYEMEKVETSIESVRQYIHTSRRNGKVWHQCRWGADNKNAQPCNYGSKWSGAMVNHIRAHLGVKPFRCLYCNKLFTIACNLKNHLRIHHGLKAKIVLNGGRKMRHLSNTDCKTTVKFSSNEIQEEEGVEETKSSDTSKLRIFKPSFVNRKVVGTQYAAQRRTLPKRSVKRNQKYVDYEEDFEEDEDRELFYNNYNEEEAEEENRKFYEKTVEEEEDYLDDDASRFVVKRRYNKRLWYVCIWNPRQCKYRSALANEVINHVKKHQNIRQLICNWNHCSASFATKQQLDSHQLIHRRQKFFKCNFPNCEFQTINETALRMHKIRHKRQM